MNPLWIYLHHWSYGVQLTAIQERLIIITLFVKWVFYCQLMVDMICFDFTLIVTWFIEEIIHFQIFFFSCSDTEHNHVGKQKQNDPDTQKKKKNSYTVMYRKGGLNIPKMDTFICTWWIGDLSRVHLWHTNLLSLPMENLQRIDGIDYIWMEQNWLNICMMKIILKSANVVLMMPKHYGRWTKIYKASFQSVVTQNASN